ncbi:uncharacterized protein LOC112049222 [Bicyclus anynana]|uniref:Uncharacterized protein LOC112049222 n=1 Tax=Bicyclus anynana TaxID=110368 RepID=A0A6J1NCR2_BICAN|nr:uncharacterized protein LOC112049222 [Bicyclus anynana]
MRWSEEATLEFVKLYLKQECLWNPHNIGYKSKHHRDKAYSEIISEFNHIKTLTIPEVKLKIKTLRTTYIQQLHKIQQKSSPDCIYEPSLFWFHEMDRCLKDVIHTNGLSSTDTQEASEADSSCMWINLHNSDDEFTSDLLVTKSDEDIDSFNGGTLTPIKLGMPYTLSSKKIKKKRLKHRRLLVLNSEDSSCLRKRYDEFDMYGRYIATQLRGMDLRKALQLQLQIQTLVSEARISDTD